VWTVTNPLLPRGVMVVACVTSTRFVQTLEVPLTHCLLLIRHKSLQIWLSLASLKLLFLPDAEIVRMTPGSFRRPDFEGSLAFRGDSPVGAVNPYKDIANEIVITLGT